MTEADEDHDGRLETIAIYEQKTGEMEVFIRQADGSTKPADAKTLAAYKKMNSALTELFDKPLFDMEADKAMKLMLETRQKIQDAGKEIERKKQ